MSYRRIIIALITLGCIGSIGYFGITYNGENYLKAHHDQKIYCVDDGSSFL